MVWLLFVVGIFVLAFVIWAKTWWIDLFAPKDRSKKSWVAIWVLGLLIFILVMIIGVLWGNL
jgi:glycerol uptake facilitator-like aquaporin